MTEAVKLSPTELAERLDRPGWCVAAQRLFADDDWMTLQDVERPFVVEDGYLVIVTVAVTRLLVPLRDHEAYELGPGVIVFRLPATVARSSLGAVVLRLEHAELPVSELV